MASHTDIYKVRINNTEALVTRTRGARGPTVWRMAVSTGKGESSATFWGKPPVAVIDAVLGSERKALRKSSRRQGGAARAA